MSEKILVTGAAGFIGYHTAQRLLKRGDHVVGIDDLNENYDVQLKKDRLELLQANPMFTFLKVSIEDRESLSKVLTEGRFDSVIHLAGQAGVRGPASESHRYITSNLVGFGNVLDCCRSNDVQHLVYASSSSVYGNEAVAPFSAHHSADHPQSLYAATKRANELLAHSYSHCYQLPTTGLRFFTVYGPWGRPDMAVYKFTRDILNGEPIEVYGDGELIRDFTYVADVTDAIVRVLDAPPTNGFEGDISPAKSHAPYRIFNVGNGNPYVVNDLVKIIEKAVGRKALIIYKPCHLADVQVTHADIHDLKDTFGFRPRTDLSEGFDQFLEWFQAYHD